MRVVAKDESGEWATWRVGRRRLAWRPDFTPWVVDGVDMTGIVLVLSVIPLVVYLLSWTAALLATTVVWPVRAATGRWPVVAYSVTAVEKGYRTRVQGRSAADELAHQWVLEIKHHGQPRRHVGQRRQRQEER